MDELDIGIVSEFLGGGLRLFEGVDNLDPKLEHLSGVAPPGRTNLLLRS